MDRARRKVTKFFLNLEKQKQKNNTICRLKTENGENISNPLQILDNIRSIYNNLYKDHDGDASFTENFNIFTDELRIPTISEGDKKHCDNEISEKEILESMKGGTAPGLDGLPVEFYKVFWNDIKGPLMASYIHSFKKGWLSTSQRKGVVTLLYKGKDREMIQNWRPISLMNTDYKILTKVLSRRLSTVLDKIINSN